MDPAKYFKGRLNRRNYVYGMVSLFVITSILTKVSDDSLLGILTSLVVLISLFLGFAIHVRRLNDINKSGWWSLLMIVPVVDFFFFIYLALAEGTGKNKFGPVPSKTINFPQDILLLKK